MLGTYTFEVEETNDGWFIARLDGPEGATGVTQGRTENEIFDMIADCYKSMMDVKVPWYQLPWWNPLWWLRKVW